MSSSTFTFITQEVTVYFGAFILIFGTIGGILNIITFLSLKTFRQKSCALYLTGMSCADLAHLILSLSSHIVIYGYNIDWAAQSEVYCKLRFFLIQLWSLTSFTCMCLATVDQYLATCFNPFWHKWSNVKLARCVVVGTVFIWTVHSLPSIFYFKLMVSPADQTKQICSVTNPNFHHYITFGFVFVFMGALPLIVMVLFGSLAYYNVQHLNYRTVPLVRRELDKQLTRMVLSQVIYNVFVLTPFVIVTIITFYSPLSEGMSSIHILSIDVHNLYFASPFYIYMCVSKRFRQQFVHIFSQIYSNRLRLPNNNNNQVAPHIIQTSFHQTST